MPRQEDLAHLMRLYSIGELQVMAYETDIVSQITEIFGQLSESEKKIARVTLDNLEFTAHASISEIAEKADVSEATITRFAKTLKCKNVRDLKLKLAQSLAVGKRFLTDVKVEPSGIHGIYDSIKAALDHNAGLITEEAIKSAVGSISQASQILVFGVGGGSTVMAQECQYRFFRLGYSTVAHSDPMLMRMAASTIDPNDVVLCLSLSGNSPDVTEAASIAKQYGANTVAVTKGDSPLAHSVDHVIPIEPIETDYIFKPSAARYVMMAAIDVLATELAIQHKRKTREKLRRIKHTLDNHRHGENRLPLGD